MSLPIGIYSSTELSIEDYHADRESISRSTLMVFDESPYRYWASYLNPLKPKFEPTPAMIFGGAFHTLILEPDLFEKHYAVEPVKVLLKDVGREQYDSYKAECEALETSGKTVLKRDTFNTMLEMQDALMNHTEACELIKDGYYERSYIWLDEHSGLKVKSRPDIIHHNMYVDIKTIADASPDYYQREMVKHGYYIQGAMVSEARRVLEGKYIGTTINICIEKEYPYSIGIYMIEQEAINAGHRKFKQLLVDLKYANVYNKYPDYKMQTVGLPNWFK